MAGINSESVGEYLRSVREKKKCTLEQAAEATKVKLENLEAIEADRITDRVPLVYAKAFVKSYAEFLGEDGAAIVATFKRRQGDASEAISPFPITPVMKTKGASLRKPLSDWRILAGAGLVAVILLYLLFGALFSRPCKVTVKATDRVLVKVYQDGRFVSGFTLPAGTEKAWKAKRSVRLTISKAENVSVLHKGRKVSIPKTGSFTVTVTRRGISVTRPS